MILDRSEYKKKSSSLSLQDEYFQMNQSEIVSSIDSDTSFLYRRKVTQLHYDTSQKPKEKIQKRPSLKYELDRQAENESLSHSLETDSKASILLPEQEQNLKSKALKNNQLFIDPSLAKKENIMKEEIVLDTGVILTEPGGESKSTPRSSLRGFMENSQNFSLSQLFSIVYEREFAKEGSWEPLSKKEKMRELLCTCFSHKNELAGQTEERLLKLIHFSNQLFNISDQSHSDILYNYYLRLGFEGEFENTSENWKRIGFSSGNIKTNELSIGSSLLNLLFLIFLIERKPGIFKIAYQLSEEFKCGVIRFTLMILNESLALLRKKKLNEIFVTDNVVLTFFELHAGVLIDWLEQIKDFGLQRSIQKAIRKAEGSPEGCRLAYINYSN